MSKQNPHPHLGNLIRAYMTKNRITKAEAGRNLGVNTTEVVKYLNRPSLQFHVLWNFCIALNYDFLGEIMNNYPPEMPLNPNGNLFKELSDKKNEILDLQKEIIIYKAALHIKN